MTKTMATLTIRQLNESIKNKLRLRAALHNRSMEAEVREILRTATLELDINDVELGFGSQIHELFADVGGVDMVSPERQPPRSVPSF